MSGCERRRSVGSGRGQPLEASLRLCGSSNGIDNNGAAPVMHWRNISLKYMIPEKFWLLDCLPSTPHGKRDVVGLEALTAVQADLASMV